MTAPSRDVRHIRLGLTNEELRCLRILTLEFDRSNDIDLHDGFKNDWSTFGESFTESTLSGESESKFGRIDLMSSSVLENEFATRNRVSSENTSFERIVETLWNKSNFSAESAG